MSVGELGIRIEDRELEVSRVDCAIGLTRNDNRGIAHTGINSMFGQIADRRRALTGISSMGIDCRRAHTGTSFIFGQEAIDSRRR